MYRLFNIFFVTFWKTRQHVQVQDANTMFTRYYQSQQDICVDETLLGTRGRTTMLQYIPSKHSKFWVKIWVLVESATDIRISRKTTSHFGGLPENFGCVALVEEKWTFGAWIPCLSDSFSTSVELAKVLLRLGTFLNGTVKYNRRISSTIRKPIYCQGTQYSCAKDVLCFLRPTRKWEETSCALFCGVLAVISVYNKNKGGVDGADKQFSFHSNSRKLLKEWKKMPFTLFNKCFLMFVYVLYKSNISEKVISRLQFLQEVIYGLPLSYPNEPTAPVQLRQTPENSKLVKLVGTDLFMNKCWLLISGQNLVDIVRYVAWKEKS